MNKMKEENAKMTAEMKTLAERNSQMTTEMKELAEASHSQVRESAKQADATTFLALGVKRDSEVMKTTAMVVVIFFACNVCWSEWVYLLRLNRTA